MLDLSNIKIGDTVEVAVQSGISGIVKSLDELGQTERGCGGFGSTGK